MTDNTSLIARLESAARERVSDAIWAVMHGYDGRLLTGEYYPGHDAIVNAAIEAFEGDPAAILKALSTASEAR